MKGRKFLNWSRGLGELKKAADAELERDKRERMQRPPIAVIDGVDVDEFKHKDGALVAILECAEKDGLSGVLWALRKYHGDGAARRCLMLTQLEQRAVARAQAPPAPPPKAEPVQMALSYAVPASADRSRGSDVYFSSTTRTSSGHGSSTV